MILKKNFLSKSECGFLMENMGTVPVVEARHECTDFQISESIMAKIVNLVQPSKPTYAIQKYEVGESFAPHRDSLKHNLRTHSASILLNNDFKGGKLFVKDEKITLEAGDCFLFHPHFLHWVTPVTKGTRYCFTVWGVRFGVFDYGQ